jgi:cell division protein FtsW (lipid II flippase)
MNQQSVKDDQGTTLRFTDIMFGFAFKEIYTRFANWAKYPAQTANATRAYLFMVLAVVLMSYVGYRKSKARKDYRLDLFSLPFARFGVDQALVAIYIVMALRIPDKNLADFKELPLGWARVALVWVLVVWSGYFLWDLLGFWMSGREKDGKRVYDEIPRRRSSFLISLAFLILFAALMIWHPDSATATFLSAAVLAIAYRLTKDYRQRLRWLVQWDQKPDA